MSGRLLGKKLTSFQILILGFASLILLGTLLLLLPFAAKSGTGVCLEHALFTATSAVCVTGLVVQDTASCWSGFGQAVILALIQIGGLGVVTFAAFISTVSGRKISLLQRSVLQDSFSAHQIGGVVRLTRFILRTALTVETAGALIMLPFFCGKYGISGIWLAVFHSVSAFCNAGFDLMGDKTGPFSSLTSFANHPGIVLPVCLLILAGGIGFLTWDDLAGNRLRFKRYRMQTKVILAASGVLILIPALLLFFGEYANYPLGERVWLSLFQSVTPRTAGFNTADLNVLSGSGRLLIIALMLIGGSPGSTAGGMKTTTAAVLVLNALAVFRKKKSAYAFGRRIDDSAIKTAATLLTMYLGLTLISGAIISAVETLPFGACLFEAASAIGTVGLSLGLTPYLGTASHILLIGLMFFGRVGGLTLIYAAVSKTGNDGAQYPVEKINVG